jgi:hypothetical protein
MRAAIRQERGKTRPWNPYQGPGVRLLMPKSPKVGINRPELRVKSGTMIRQEPQFVDLPHYVAK